MRRRHLVFFAVWPLIAVAAEPELEFAGVIAAGGKTLVSVRDAATGTATWVEVGARYKEFTVSSYDANESKLVLTKDGAATTLSMKEGKVKSAPPMAPGVIDAPADLASLKSQRLELSKRYKDGHPTMVALDKKIAELESQGRAGNSAK